MELTGHYTDEGRALLSQSLSAGLHITRVVAASGTTDDIDGATALTGPEQTLTLIPGQKQAPGTTIPAILTAAEAARRYNLREVGVFAQSGDGPERLLCVYQLDAPVSISPDSRLVLRFLLTLTLSDILALTVTLSPVGLVTVEDLLDERALWPNRNLLDNWDFHNPVNQRGETVYVGHRYGIDRWMGRNANTTVTVNDGYITLSNAVTDGNNHYISQQRENPIPAGTTVTLSVEYKNASGNVYILDWPTEEYAFPTGTTQWAIKSKTWTLSADLSFLPAVFIPGAAPVGSIDIRRMKLEIGSVSTLANDPPADYGEELRRCQRYFQRIKGISYAHAGNGFFWNTNTASCDIRISCPLRTIPTIDSNGVYMLYDDQAVSSSSITYIGYCDTSVSVNVVGPTTVEIGEMCVIDVRDGGYIDLSADL